jgi:hypothetical protein
LFAQSTIKVSSIYGPVEWKATTSNGFVSLTPTIQTVHIGDELRTGPGGTAMLELPDGSYMVVSENSRLIIQDYWSRDFRSMVNLMLGKVRFYIQRFGGKPNPYRVTTPTALIAVRGTTFEVSVDPTMITEVRCLEGRVAVETAGLPDREVVLDEGWKTLVRAGEYPMTPVGNDEALLRNRVVQVVRKSVPETEGTVAGVPSIDVLVRDNDRRNRTPGLLSPASRTNTDVMRAKGTLTFPKKQ